MKGYKIFNPDWTCNGFKYEVGGTYRIEGMPICCKKGFHFCKNLAECFKYYPFDPNNKIAMVESRGGVVTDDGRKFCTNAIKISSEISWAECLQLGNSGYGNSGYGNSGNWNSGDGNSGNGNSGDWNSGNWNSGLFNATTPTLRMFNKPCDWTYMDWKRSTAHELMQMFSDMLTKWVVWEDMTDDQKKEYPEAETLGGTYILRDGEETGREFWKSLSEKDRQEILSLPNFDAEIFKETTGIDVTETEE